MPKLNNCLGFKVTILISHRATMSRTCNHTSHRFNPKGPPCMSLARIHPAGGRGLGLLHGFGAWGEGMRA